MFYHCFPSSRCSSSEQKQILFTETGVPEYYGESVEILLLLFLLIINLILNLILYETFKINEKIWRLFAIRISFLTFLFEIQVDFPSWSVQYAVLQAFLLKRNKIWILYKSTSLPSKTWRRMEAWPPLEGLQV